MLYHTIDFFLQNLLHFLFHLLHNVGLPDLKDDMLFLSPLFVLVLLNPIFQKLST